MLFFNLAETSKYSSTVTVSVTIQTTIEMTNQSTIEIMNQSTTEMMNQSTMGMLNLLLCKHDIKVLSTKYLM
jgi:hypothetical protein